MPSGRRTSFSRAERLQRAQAQQAKQAPQALPQTQRTRPQEPPKKTGLPKLTPPRMAYVLGSLTPMQQMVFACLKKGENPAENLKAFTPDAVTTATKNIVQLMQLANEGVFDDERLENKPIEDKPTRERSVEQPRRIEQPQIAEQSRIASAVAETREEKPVQVPPSQPTVRLPAKPAVKPPAKPSVQPPDRETKLYSKLLFHRDRLLGFRDRLIEKNVIAPGGKLFAHHITEHAGSELPDLRVSWRYAYKLSSALAGREGFLLSSRIPVDEANQLVSALGFTEQGVTVRRNSPFVRRMRVLRAEEDLRILTALRKKLGKQELLRTRGKIPPKLLVGDNWSLLLRLERYNRELKTPLEPSYAAQLKRAVSMVALRGPSDSPEEVARRHHEVYSAAFNANNRRPVNRLQVKTASYQYALNWRNNRESVSSLPAQHRSYVEGVLRMASFPGINALRGRNLAAAEKAIKQMWTHVSQRRESAGKTSLKVPTFELRNEGLFAAEELAKWAHSAPRSELTRLRPRLQEIAEQARAWTIPPKTLNRKMGEKRKAK